MSNGINTPAPTCETCKWYDKSESGLFDSCNHGKKSKFYTDHERSEGNCGPEGKNWEGR